MATASSSSNNFSLQEQTTMSTASTANEIPANNTPSQIRPPSRQPPSSTPNQVPASNQTTSGPSQQHPSQTQISANQPQMPPNPSNQPPIPSMGMFPANQPPHPIHPPVVMSPPQLQLLRLQIMAYKCIARSQPLPENVRMALLDPKRNIGGVFISFFKTFSISSNII